MGDSKSAPVDEFFQKVKDNTIKENLELSPAYAREFDVSNKILRAFVHLFAKGPNSALRLICNAAGQLEVVTAGTAFDNYEEKSYTSESTEQLHVFAQVVKQVEISLIDGDALVKLSNDGVSFGTGIFIERYGSRMFPVNVLALKINKSALSSFSCQIIGWY